MKERAYVFTPVYKSYVSVTRIYVAYYWFCL